MKFKIHSTDHGFCRINYVTRNEKNERLYYCLQQSSHTAVSLYRCTQDGEPSHEVTMLRPAIELFEKPSEAGKLEDMVRTWIDTNQGKA
jgi:hypothetical protein